MLVIVMKIYAVAGPRFLKGAVCANLVLFGNFFVENYMKLDRAESPAPNPTPGSAYVFTLVWNILLWTS